MIITMLNIYSPSLVIKFIYIFFIIILFLFIYHFQYYF